MDIALSTSAHLSVADKAMLHVTLYDTISAIPEQDWLKFVDASTQPLLMPSYLQLLEDTQQGQMQFIYALLYRESALIGVCYFQIVRFLGTNLVPYFPVVAPDSLWNKLKIFVLNFFKRVVGSLDLPLLVSGNLFITGEQGLYFQPPITEFQKSHYLKYVIDQIFKARPYLKAALLPDIYEPSGDFDDAFISNQYNRNYVEADMSMILPASWKTFDDYLTAISSKYRVRAKKILHTSAPIEYHDMDIDTLKLHEDRLFDLYKAVADKADFNIAKFTKGYYVAQKQLTPDTYRILGYFYEGRLVGFMSLFLLPHKAEVHYCGIDYTINKDLALYQRMLYDVVKFAIDNRLYKLHFGRTAPEVKSTIGAVPQPMYGYLRHRNPIINAIMGIFTSQLKPREYVLRSPFK